MNKKIFVILFLTLCIGTAIAAPVDNGGHAGTPPGFYDDIDPNSLDDDDEIVPLNQQLKNPAKNSNTLHEFTDEDEIILPEPQAKATKNYAQIYNDLELADFSYLHDIDPARLGRVIRSLRTS